MHIHEISSKITVFNNIRQKLICGEGGSNDVLAIGRVRSAEHPLPPNYTWISLY